MITGPKPICGLAETSGRPFLYSSARVFPAVLVRISGSVQQPRESLANTAIQIPVKPQRITRVPLAARSEDGAENCSVVRLMCYETILSLPE